MDDDLIDTIDDQCHPRTIIHIDIDCFYAQVEEILNPELRTKPLGIQQKNIIVTCNYVARTFGVGKLMLLTEALKRCPDLVLVKGEDLTNYRRMSAKIFDVLTTFTHNVEKLGMDENYMDVTSIVEQKWMDSDEESRQSMAVEGFTYPETESLSSCNCGCARRLTLATHLAKEIRERLFNELEITCCAGIAHNKLLAKIVGTKNKPNKQTVLVPFSARSTLTELSSLRGICGVGEKTELLLNEIGIKSVEDLQNIESYKLQQKFGKDLAVKLKCWSVGVDESAVKTSGKPKSISLEDSCKSISLRADVEDKFRLLLIRLVNQVTEDGRIPIVIKIILRKFDSVKKSSHRETKQANILPSMFKQLGDGKIILMEGGQDKLLKIVMRLFERSIDLKRPFNITLLGLAFSKFQERKKGSRSIANFLIKKSDVEVQSITSLSSDGFSPNSTADSFRRYVTSSPMLMDLESISDTASHASCSDVSESEIEPSPKKTRIGFLIAKRRCLSSNEPMDAASPSKLRVGDLRLNSRDSERDVNMSSSISPTSTPNLSNGTFNGCNSTASSSFLFTTNASSSSITNLSISSIPDCPPTVDPEVFKELPLDVQQELLAEWRTPIGGSSTPKPTRINSSTASNIAATTSSAKNKTNTLHRYFITNKQL